MRNTKHAYNVLLLLIIRTNVFLNWVINYSYITQFYLTAELIGKTICKLIYETGKVQKDKW